MVCDRLRARVEELEDQYEVAREGCNDGIKGDCTLAAQLLPQLKRTREELQRCLNQPATGTVFPRYLVTHLIYSPPGIGSEVSYETGSTAGITTEATKSFKSGLKMAAKGKMFGNGLEGSFAVTGGVKSGQSFEVEKTADKGPYAESQNDGIDHSQDIFLIWTNVRADLALHPGDDLRVSLGTADGGQYMEMVRLNVAELRDPSLIPEEKRARLGGLTPKDFSQILSLHPLLGSGDPDPARFRKTAWTLPIEGPDHPGDTIQGYSVSVSDAQASGVISGATRELSVDLTVELGFNLFSVLEFGADLTQAWTWEYETSANLTAGETEAVEVRLESSTAGYYEIFDIYQDTMFKTFAFVSRTKKFPEEKALVAGTVMDSAWRPIAHVRVDVVGAKGELVRSTLTNAHGGYRIFGVADGPVRIMVGDVAEEVTIDAGKPLDLWFQIGGENSRAIRASRVTIDGRKLSHDLLLRGLPGQPAIVLSNDAPQEIALVPGLRYGFSSAPGVLADFEFGVDAAGMVSMDPRYSRFAKAGGRTLTIDGYRVTVDGRKLSHDLLPALLGRSGPPLSNDAPHTLTLIAGAGYSLRATTGGVACIFTVDAAGTASVTKGDDVEVTV